MRNRLPDLSSLIESIKDRNPVIGYTHAHYRYPARFSPRFAEAAITTFTQPGDIVYDPFMGGGTSLIEALRLDRKSVGTDLNSLAVFIAKVKTAMLTDDDFAATREWVERGELRLKLNRLPVRPEEWITRGYQRNVSGRTTWPIRKTLELAIQELETLANDSQKDFVRCLLLKTAQWAIDCRQRHPSAASLRRQLKKHLEQMIEGSTQLRAMVGTNPTDLSDNGHRTPICLCMPAKDIANPGIYPHSSAPKLIITSPPYPGVHVLYHRWQVNGRRETPAPYWIANCVDGNGASYYTFGYRRQDGLVDYYEKMRESYSAISAIADDDTWLIQLVAFSTPEWQLPLFLKVIEECGFDEVSLDSAHDGVDGRIWRPVPNRKFYANQKGSIPSSKEFLLIHKFGRAL